jgi:glutathione S-transferase
MFEGAEPDRAKYTKLEEAYQIFDKLLEGHTWAAGDHLTIADLALVATVSSAEVSVMISFCFRPIGESNQRRFSRAWCKLEWFGTRGISERWMKLCWDRFL